MSERLASSIRDIVRFHLSTRSVGEVDDGQSEEALRFVYRLDDLGGLTRNENPYNHFCVYFPGIDLVANKVFLGHHKKAGLWLFNGGHIDKGEVPLETLNREISEEWGENANILGVPERPSLLTTTYISNPPQKCNLHYDIWYFVELDSGLFTPDKDKVLEEFYEARWFTLEEARRLVVDPSTLTALDAIGEKFKI